MKLQKFLSVVEGSSFTIYHRFLMTLTEKELNTLLRTNRLNDETTNLIRETFNYPATNNDVERMMYADLFFNSPNDVIYKVMKMSSIAHIRTHFPLLEKNLVNISSSIPLKYKMNKKDKKIIFKDVFQEYIPKEVVNASKRGFGVPIGEWFKGDLRTEFYDVMSRNRKFIGKFLNMNVLDEYIDKHMSESNDHSHLLWSVFVFAIWFEENPL